MRGCVPIVMIELGQKGGLRMLGGKNDINVNKKVEWDKANK